MQITYIYPLTHKLKKMKEKHHSCLFCALDIKARIDSLLTWFSQIHRLVQHQFTSQLSAEQSVICCLHTAQHNHVIVMVLLVSMLVSVFIPVYVSRSFSVTNYHIWHHVYPSKVNTCLLKKGSLLKVSR